MSAIARPESRSNIALLPQRPRVAAIAGLAFVLAEWRVATEPGNGPREVLLVLIGLLIGATLLGARFGFSSAFRQAVEERDLRGFRAHALMFAVAGCLIVPLTAEGMLFGHAVTGFANPIGPSFILGAVLFGVGMQLSGGCASGTLYLLGGGNLKFALTLATFIVGSVVGAAHMGFWWRLPSLPPLTVFTIAPWPVGLAIDLLACLAMAVVTFAVGRERTAPLPRRLLMGALILALLNAATVLVAGHPWTETYGFTLWGSKLAAFLGWYPQYWTFWQGSPALAGSVFSDTTSIMDMSILIGALLAGAWNGTFRLQIGGSARSLLAAACGGFIMGYGARLSGGCNIGAYFSTIASGDFSGWLWAATAVLTTTAGIRLRSWIEAGGSP